MFRLASQRYRRPHIQLAMLPGMIHVALVVGTLKNRVKLQYQFECFFIIADLHMLTPPLCWLFGTSVLRKQWIVRTDVPNCIRIR